MAYKRDISLLVNASVDGFMVDTLQLWVDSGECAVFDFLPYIRPHEVGILEAWQDWFKSKREPFLVTVNRGVFRLWKRYIPITGELEDDPDTEE